MHQKHDIYLHRVAISGLSAGTHDVIQQVVLRQDFLLQGAWVRYALVAQPQIITHI